jgi:hypothetical protein
MFAYPRFNVQVSRKVNESRLRWPSDEHAAGDGLGGNRNYADLRRFPWDEALEVFKLEGELMARVEASADPEQEYELIEDELYEELSINLCGLDLGVAAAVLALSAAGCVPFSSCNAGTFGGGHPELYPLVAFYGRKEAIALLLACAEEADAGLESDDGAIVLYAADIPAIRRFAEAVFKNRALFDSLQTRSSQGSLF